MAFGNLWNEPQPAQASNPFFANESVIAETTSPFFDAEPSTPTTKNPFWPYPKEERLVIDFEDLAAPGSEVFVQEGYAGFNWQNAGAIDNGGIYPISGYNNVIQSGDAAGYNPFQQVLTFSLAEEGSFDLVSGYFAAAWNNDLTVTVEALRGDDVVGTAVLTLNPEAAEIDFFAASATHADGQFTGDFTDLDSVRFTSEGGTNAGFGGGGTHFAMDDLQVQITPADPFIA